MSPTSFNTSLGSPLPILPDQMLEAVADNLTE